MSVYRDFDDDLYSRDSFSRKRDLAREVFQEEFSARERAFRHDREMRSGLPPLGPDDPYYNRMDELDRREYLGHGPRFGDPPFDPPLLSPSDPLPPLDRPLPPLDRPLPPMGMWPGPGGPEARRMGSVVVYPPKGPRFPVKDTEPPSRTLYVGTLPKNTTKHHLEEIFSQFGRIEYIRLNHNYAHIQFSLEDKPKLMRALDMDGSFIGVGPTNSPEDFGAIVVEFSIRRGDVEGDKKSELEPMPYSKMNAANLSGNLYKEAKFMGAALSLKQWLEQGQCNSSTSNTFYSLLTSTNTCTRRAKKLLKEKEGDLKEAVKKYRKELGNMEIECQAIINIFHAASQQKARDNFSKAQRKMISQWADGANELMEEIKSLITNPELCLGESGGLPPAKMRKTECDESIEAMQREVRQIKAEKDVAIQGRDSQIQSLKDLLTKFKEECPSEWERLTEGKDVLQEISYPPSVNQDPSQDNSSEDAGLEIIEEVGMEDAIEPTPTTTAKTDEMDIEDQEKDEEHETMTDPSLAAAAAAYAQIRSTIGSSGQEGIGLSEPEVAIISVMAAFLAVHPMGASIEEITMYFQGFNPSYNSHYLESLLRRLSKVFQLSATGDSPGKWWFLGFQTCYAAVGDTRTAEAAAPPTDQAAESAPTEQNSAT